MIRESKMKKWSQKEISDFVNSPEFKKAIEKSNKDLNEYHRKLRQDFIDNLDEYIKAINTPMAI